MSFRIFHFFSHLSRYVLIKVSTLLVEGYQQICCILCCSALRYNTPQKQPLIEQTIQLLAALGGVVWFCLFSLFSVAVYHVNSCPCKRPFSNAHTDVHRCAHTPAWGLIHISLLKGVNHIMAKNSICILCQPALSALSALSVHPFLQLDEQHACTPTNIILCTHKSFLITPYAQCI